MDSIDWALDVLELGPNATADEIKRAYRDLTKVWHPDRFSNDLRLREKANEKLKEIIDAYKLLTGSHAARQARERAPRTAAPPPSAGNARGQATRPPPPSARSPDAQPKTSPSLGVRAWRAVTAAIAVVGVIGYFVAQPTERPAVSAPTPPASPNGETRLPVDTADPTSSIELSQQAGPATPTPATLPEFVRPNALREPRREDGLGSTDPDLSLLSRAEQESIESACRDARLEQGPAAYGQCLTDLLTRLANGPARPDLSLLSRIELASIEAACNSARLAQGPAAYNQCLTDLLADLANTPPRPDLSLLIRAERDAIESACRHARLAQGPAAYNQCLADQLATLDR